MTDKDKGKRGKMIRVEHCNGASCKFCKSVEIDGTKRFMCFKEERLIDPSDSLPSWCPLEDIPSVPEKQPEPQQPKKKQSRKK